ncbi:MAG: ArdC-like ssDNA-binding domain-containing protein [Pirellula sp.]
MNRDEALKTSDDALKELAEALRQGKSEKLVEYLGMMSKFHHYSFGNCILIAIQKPEATFVAGFGRWKELGRFVKKGEKGIAILAPLVGKRKKDSDEPIQKPEVSNDSAESPSGKVLYGFRVVHVFDVNQTEGQELPNFASLGGDPGAKFERLEEIIKGHGIAIEYVDQLPFDANGMSEGGKITINATRPKAQMFSTMVHELAHELLHWGDRRASTTKVIRETEAEAVAYVVCKSTGLELSTRSADYIQLWSGDEKVLLQSLEHIRNVASKILSELNTNPVSAEVADVA